MTFWYSVLGNIISNLFSGIILLLIGGFFFKYLRKNEKISEASIDKELKLQYVVNEFKRIREKYTTPLDKNSSSLKVEQELTTLYGHCREIEELSNKYNLLIESDLVLLMNQIYAQKGLLYCNNGTKIENEKIPMFQNINKMISEGINYNVKIGRTVYFELYKNYETEINSLIQNKTFFKNYWKY